MNDHLHRIRNVAGAGLLVAAVLLVGLTFMGGQSSKILSTVGAAIPDNEGNGQVDTGGGDPGSTGDTTGEAGSGSASVGGPVANAASVTIPTLLIVRTGDLTIQVSDLAAALAAGDAAITRAGGYVSGSTQAGGGGGDNAVVTYRIPSAAWDATLATLRGLATKILSEDVKTDEVSGQVVDLTSRIANLRATEAALQAIMARATKISDVLDVQAQLTTTRGEIEQLVGDQAHLRDQAAYGSLTVTYRLPAVSVPTAAPSPAKGWDPGDDVARASGKLVRIGQTTTSIGIWLAIVGLPIAIGGLVVLFASYQAYRLGRWAVRKRDAVGTGS
jgi:hypothetical protein